MLRQRHLSVPCFASNGPAAAEAGEEGKPLTKKQKAAQQKALQEAKERREAVGADRMAPEVGGSPLGGWALAFSPVGPFLIWRRSGGR